MEDLFWVLIMALTSFGVSSFLLVFLANRKGIRMRTPFHKRIENTLIRWGISPLDK